MGNLVEAGLASLKVAQKHGVKIAYGSDLLGELHSLQCREFELRCSVLPAVDVLRQATVNAAELFGLQGEIGRIEPGYRADLLVVSGNPLEDNLRALVDSSAIKMVIKEGIIAATNGELKLE